MSKWVITKGRDGERRDEGAGKETVEWGSEGEQGGRTLLNRVGRGEGRRADQVLL